MALPPAMLPIEPPSRQSPEPRVVGPGELVEMLRVGGDVYSVPDLATLQRWILEGRASRGDAVSQHGMRWTLLGDRPDFAVFFSAADAVGGRGTTLAPTDSPIRPNPARLSMADDEEIYVQEVNPGEGEATSTSFVGAAPEPEEAPTIRELPWGAASPAAEELVQAAESLEFPERDDPEPVDELPPEMLTPPRRFVDNPDHLAAFPAPPGFRHEALSLGFQLGPDPDTQEATIEETRRSEANNAQVNDLTENFMRTGVLPSMPPSPSPMPTPPPTPPPVVLGGGRVPVTVAPSAPRSILDDDFDAPPPKRQGHGPELFIGGAFFLAILLTIGGWMMRPAKPEAPPPPPSAPVELDTPPTVGATAIDDAAVEAAAKADEEAQAARQAREDAQATAQRKADAKAEADAQVAAAAKVDDEARADAKAKARVEAEQRAARAAAASSPPAAPKPPAPKPGVSPEPSKAGGNAKQLTDQGWKAIDKGEIETAHGLFARALQKNPTYPPALNGRGYANEKLGDKVSARADYCAALEGAGTDADLTRELTGSLRRLGAGCGPK